MHENIRRFEFEGKIGDDADFTRLRAQYESLMTHQMRDLGYVRQLDLDTHWTTEYIATEEVYTFKLSIYGIKVGKKRACKTYGISNGKEIPLSTTQNKSKPA